MKIYYWNKNNNKQLYELWYNIFHDSKNFCNYYFKEKLIDNRVIVIEKNHNILSMIHLNPYKLSLQNIQIHSEYIVGVSTKVNYRGKGFLKLLMTAVINDMYNEKTEITFLTTVDENIYTRYDFRYISSYIESELTKIKIQVTSNYTCLELDILSTNNFLSYYNKKMKETFNGYIFRDIYYIERLIKEMHCENGTIQLFYKNGNVKGYIMLYIFETNIQIRELVYDIDILLDIISYLQDIIKDNKTIRLTYPCNQRLEYILQHYFISYSNIKPYMMARIIFIKSFLERIKSNINVIINISISDSVIQQNNGTFKWSISSDYSSLIQTDETPDIITDIGTLTQWVCGYISIEELITLNLLQITNLQIIDSLKSIIIYNSIFINEVV